MHLKARRITQHYLEQFYGTNPLVPSGKRGFVSYDILRNVPGWSIDEAMRSLEVLSRDWTRSLHAGTSFPSNIGDNYVRRVRGFITVPEAGEYTFGISSDETSVFYLSPNERKFFNIPQYENFTLRVGDSLRLGVAESDAEIAVNGTSLGNVAAGTAIVHKFTTAGTHTVSASWTDAAGETQSASVAVSAISVELGEAMPLILNRSRVWALANAPAGLFVEFAEPLSLRERLSDSDSHARHARVSLEERRQCRRV